jgi:hypothetical protein
MQYVEWHNHYVDHEEVRRFRDHKKDWFVESETSVKMAETAKDKYEGEKEEPFEEASACFRIGNDGSIYAEDTWGSIFSMTNEDIVLSARRDVKIQAGRDIQITGTREGTIRTQKDLDVVSHEGTVRVKGHEDLLLAADNGNAALDSGKGNVNINSRQKDVLIRAERESIVMKADLKDIRAVSVEGDINLRAKNDVQIASDDNRVLLHGSVKVQATSEGGVLLATGPESPSLSMTGTKRDIGRFTDVTESKDEGKVVGLSRAEAFVNLVGNKVDIHGREEASLSSEFRAKVFSPGAKVSFVGTSYTLSSSGSGKVIRSGNLEITPEDDDSDGQNNKTWRAGDSHSSEEIPSTSSDKLIMTEADIKKSEFASGRFRYKTLDKRGDKIKNYTYPWNNEGEKVNLTKSLDSWSNLIPADSQEIPDVGYNRPILDDSQDAIKEEDTEQISPYSNYVKYVDGSFSYKEGVKPGKFEETKEVMVPTSWEENPKSKGRLNLIPEEANGESFEGTLEDSSYEDPVNTKLNFE